MDVLFWVSKAFSDYQFWVSKFFLTTISTFLEFSDFSKYLYKKENLSTTFSKKIFAYIKNFL